ncbi:MAG TPA: SpoIID/LytB domain-containing protein [Myxococcaceae bacterium]|nr:SpoIID/LytB domain-containing protein [Myxococcaceae bacterium]
MAGSCRSALLAVSAALLAVAPARANGGSALLVLSRHSGQVLAGEDFRLADSPGATALAAGLGGGTARALAEAARLQSDTRLLERRAAGGLVLEVDADRVVVRAPSVSVPVARRGDGAVEVQVFGLVGSSRVRVLCDGQGFRVGDGRATPLAPGASTLGDLLGHGSLLCAGGPWQVRVAGSQARPYAGIFSFRPLPDRPPEPGSTPREARARRGSEVIFRTTLSAYVSGVLAAERAGLGGEAGLALARVIAHDAHVGRHPGRPLCDTTHCQAFLGTAPVSPEVTRALALPELPTTRWLPYFRGGDETWELRRSAAEVHAALGEVRRFGGDGRVLEVTTPGGVERIPCEPLRAALRLPSCPTEGLFEGGTVRIRGRGRGHGLGLDIEAARRSGLAASELLRRAYGL